MSQAHTIKVDEETQKNLTELAVRKQQAQQQLYGLDIQIDGLKKRIRRNELIGAQISDLPDSTRTFESVGRMFVLEERRNISESISRSIETDRESVRSGEQKREYVEKTISETSDQLKEILKQLDATAKNKL